MWSSLFVFHLLNVKTADSTCNQIQIVCPVNIKIGKMPGPGEREIQPRYQAILNFWFGDPENPEITGYGKEQPYWWSSTPEMDNQIREKFLGDYEKARAGEYEAWKQEPYGTLALIVLFDQIPRNIFRGTAQTYATDHLAQELAKMALKRGYARTFRMVYEKKFLMLPFAHSENLEDQALSVALTQEFGVGSWSNVTNRYYDIIKKFGRFPHRNSVLGRESTPAEMQMLRKEW